MTFFSLSVLTALLPAAAPSPAVPLAVPLDGAAALTPFEALEAAGAPAPRPGLAAPPQRSGIVTVRKQPRFFVSVGYHEIEPNHRYDDTDDPALSVDAGFLSWSGDMGFGLEAGVMQSKFKTDVTVFTKDNVDTTRYLLGVRFIDYRVGSDFAPYLRGGYVRREDKGHIIDDTGGGYYFGGGIDWKVAGTGFSLAPQLMCTSASSLGASEWLLGLNASYAF